MIKYKTFLENNYKWVDWITVIDSWKPWKNIWIIALTHWNEIVWLEVFYRLLKDFDIKNKLKSWKIYFISANIESYKKWLRFIDDDLNRISDKQSLDNSYEFSRFKELTNVLDELDYAIDLHSVSKWDLNIWICDEYLIDESLNFFDIKTILYDDLSNSWALISYLIRKNKKAFWIECWNHNSKDSFIVWYNNVLNFLSYYWFIDFCIKTSSVIDKYKFIYEIYPKSANFKFLDDYNWFTKIKKWEAYAIDNEYDYINNYWFDVYIWLCSKNIKYWESAWFLFKKTI